MNKTIITMAVVFLLLGASVAYLGIRLSQPITPPQTINAPVAEIAPLSFTENPYAKIPVINAYYEGKEIWFVHTDVSNEDMAKRLAKMVNYPVTYSALLGKLPADKLGKLYVFINGIKQDSVKPWNGGPFGYQIDIVDSELGDSNYTPLRNPSLVAWKATAAPRVLKSMAELLAAEKGGELAIKPTNVIVNVPIVKQNP